MGNRWEMVATGDYILQNHRTRSETPGKSGNRKGSYYNQLVREARLPRLRPDSWNR